MQPRPLAGFGLGGLVRLYRPQQEISSSPCAIAMIVAARYPGRPRVGTWNQRKDEACLIIGRPNVSPPSRGAIPAAWASVDDFSLPAAPYPPDAACRTQQAWTERLAATAAPASGGHAS